MSKDLKKIIIAAVVFAVALLTEKLAFIDNAMVSLIVVISLYLIAYITVGYDVIKKAIKNISRGEIFDENFLMLIASVGAFLVGEYAESCAVMLFYQIGEYFQSYAVGKSRSSIASLMDIRPDKATKLVDGNEVDCAPEELFIGDEIIVKKGEKIPCDGVVIYGETELDTKALTGESALRKVAIGDNVLSGSINDGAVIKIRVEKEYFDSTVSKILDLVENVSGKKAKSENFITKFAKVYTPIVCGLALALAIIPSIITKDFATWSYRALSFLVVSCPCALVISVPMAFFGGIGGASRYGILVKGGNYLELLTKLDTVVFDKTGTITKGSFEVVDVYPEDKKDEIIAIAAIAEKDSNHPIAKSIMSIAKDVGIGYSVNEISGKGLMAKKDNDIILVGSGKLMQDNGVKYEENDSVGTIVYVAKNGKFVGSIVIADKVKDEAKQTIKELNELGIKTIMLTGDNELVAKDVAKRVGISSYRADLLPGDKVDELEKIMEKSDGVTAFVGDGINDAPVLMRSDIGVSMGGIGSDSAIEAADVVLMRDNLDGLTKIRKIAKKTIRIANENIYLSLLIKIAVLVLVALGFANMWIAVFADVGVAFLAVCNSLRAMR